jgi:hypothetical protein
LGTIFVAKVRRLFVVFELGSRATFNQHHHALMAIEGDHNWSDEQIAKAINEIDRNRSKRHWEKDVDVDFNWIKGNRFHSYVARYAAYHKVKCVSVTPARKSISGVGIAV